jgi:hypothetical protein
MFEEAFTAADDTGDGLLHKEMVARLLSALNMDPGVDAQAKALLQRLQRMTASQAVGYEQVRDPLRRQLDQPEPLP